ncbi:Two-component response regulator ARR2 [Phytophthora citrophthora]|uniref:Two-component response regulator ARR2 n=1 Tax=Phytophthora citrophthora TaxID=4793 RepID=A0AAD9GRT7_9STRA|nr:Two-component response regulator ARR2 [Phytophthora citrophthora]
MNPARSPATDNKSRSGTSNGSPASASASAAAAASSSSSKRRKADTVASTGEDKPPSKQRKYERKTKRFIWPDDLHRLFVAAIFDVGLKNASPKALLALMEAAGPNSGLTTEHLKSHLQKYRLNYERSRMEFLEYYDRSAKRNMKRRRRQAQQRLSGAGSEANTMFVFPISNSKRRKSRGSDSDSDDSDSDTGDSNMTDSRMEVDAKGQATPQGRRESPAASVDAHARTLNYSQLMQSAQQQPILNGSGHSHHHPRPTNDRMIPVVPVPASSGMIPIAPQHLPPAYAAHAQRKQAPDHDRELAAAAAAVAAYRYPLGQLPAAGMPELSDPQWSILNSLMSPQLAGMAGPVGEGGMLPPAATSDAMARGSSGADGFMLHEEPNDLQMQMHLAMQAQMNLHRQMLTRKVEVAQHLARHNSMGAINTSAVPNNDSRGNPQAAQRDLGESWGSAQQLQQQQQYQHHPQQQQQQQYQQQIPVTQLSRPSLSAPASSSPAPVVATSVPTEIIAASSEEMVVSTSVSGTGPGDSSATALTSETKNDDDGMDLYRWDRIDLNVELDDDDLFGFLKS